MTATRTDLLAVDAAIKAVFDANPSPTRRDQYELGWLAHEFDAILHRSGIRCPDCGGHISVDTAEVTQAFSPWPRYIPGRWECLGRPTGRTGP